MVAMPVITQGRGRSLYCGSRSLPSLAGTLGHCVLMLHACSELGWVSHVALHCAMGTFWLGFILPDPKHRM